MSHGKLCRWTSVSRWWRPAGQMRREALGRLCLGGPGRGSSLDPPPVTDGAYKQPLPPSGPPTPAGNTVSGMMIKTEGWPRQRAICLRVQSSSCPLQVSTQWDGRGQDTINSRCIGGCAARPCINIDSLCIPALHYLRGADAKRRECIRGWRLKLDWKGLVKTLPAFLCGRNNSLYQGQGQTAGQQMLVYSPRSEQPYFSKAVEAVCCWSSDEGWKHQDEESLEGSPAPAGSAATAGALGKSASWASEELITADCEDFCRNQWIHHRQQHYDKQRI